MLECDYMAQILPKNSKRRFHFWIVAGAAVLFGGMYLIERNFATASYDTNKIDASQTIFQKAVNVLIPPPVPPKPVIPPLDTVLYDAKLNDFVNGDVSGLWPVKTDYPLAGAILPFKRVVAYYGNLYSTKMGALGQYPEAERRPIRRHQYSQHFTTLLQRRKEALELTANTVFECLTRRSTRYSRWLTKFMQSYFLICKSRKVQ